MTETPDEEVILEPGDPGYVAPNEAAPSDPQDPNAPPPDDVPEGWEDPADKDQIEDPVPIESPPGEIIRHERLADESDSDYVLRTRNMVVESLSPTDVVPNTPQITMGPREEVDADADAEIETVDVVEIPPNEFDPNQPNVPSDDPERTEAPV